MPNKPLTIAVDFQSTQGRPTGIGRFAADLVSAVARAAPQIRFLRYTAKSSDLNALQRVFWESVELPLRALNDKPDLVYSPGFSPAIFSPAPQVVTVHDLIGKVYPQNQGPVSRFYWSSWLPFALKRARFLVASSESTKRDIERFLGIPGETIEVIPLSAGERFVKKKDPIATENLLFKYGIRRPFLISVSTLEPRKNHGRLLEAYAKLRRSKDPGFSLVVVGKPGGAEQALYRFVEETKMGDFVRFLGYLSEDELVTLMNAAAGYALLSLYEGFGLPVLEAMSCGISGIAANRSSLPEITKDTALLVDPENVDEITGALAAYMNDERLRDSLCAAAYERSKDFSCLQTARRMIRVFERAAEIGRGKL